MKRIFGKILMFIPVCIMLLMVGAFLNKRSKAEEAAEKIRRLPLLTLKDIYGKPFTTAGLTRGPLLITFFHPECEFCKFEISSFLANDDLKERLTIVLVSYADSSEIMSFANQMGITDTSGLNILHDPYLQYSNMFGADMIPSNYIYDDSLRLDKVFKGSVRPETILKYINDKD